MPVGEMLQRMSSRELQEWRAYFLLKQEEANPKPPDAKTALKSWFGHRVQKKGT